LLDKEGGNVSLIWVPRHKGIAGNEQANIEAKTALKDNGEDPIIRPKQVANHESQKTLKRKVGYPQQQNERKKRQNRMIQRYSGNRKKGPMKNVQNPNRIHTSHAWLHSRKTRCLECPFYGETEQKRREMNINKKIWNEWM
jgi:hypothetical protein